MTVSFTCTTTITPALNSLFKDASGDRALIQSSMKTGLDSALRQFQAVVIIGRSVLNNVVLI